MAEQLPLHFEFKGNQNFDDFSPGGNQEIIEHLQNCLSNNGEQLIFLWGDHGLGKTHLLQACCQQAFKLQLSTFYLPPDTKKSPGIFEGLEEINVVCIDNIHRLAGNIEWEKAFFDFFNRLRDRGNRLILSANLPPNELPIRLPDLKPRLAWGLPLKLQPLDEEQQIAALTLRADKMGLEIPPQVGRFLLSHYTRDLLELWRLLDRLDHATLSAKRKLTIPFVKEILGL